jgi:hypothetical protein
MSSKASEKIIEAVTLLVEGFAELQENAEEYGITEDTGEEDEANDEADEGAANGFNDALVTELRAVVESVIDNEDCGPEDLATILSALGGALEEVAPEVFAQGEGESSEGAEGEDEEYEDEEDLDIDEDDYDYDDDEEEEEEDGDDEEEEEDDDEDED